MSVIGAAARALLFQPGSTRSVLWGAARGIRYHVSPQMAAGRLSAFLTRYEPTVVALLREHVTPGMTVYDVGAHIGIHALILARLVGAQGRVLAFEPWAENETELRRNIAVNPDLAPRITPIAAAVGYQPGTIGMKMGAGDGRHRLVIDETPDRLVPVVTLDAIAREVDAPPDFVLIDVEGAELAVIGGMLPLIAARRPTILVEYHAREARQRLHDVLTKYDYPLREIDDRYWLAPAPR